MSNQDNEKNKRLHETIGALETGDAIPAAPSPGSNAEEVRKRVTGIVHNQNGRTLDVGPRVEEWLALLESFRAETLERAKQAAHEVYVKWPTQSLGGMDERIGMALGNLQADPNWLARQIAEAQIAELDALETVMDEAGVLAEWGSVAQIRYKNRRRAALAATKSQLTEGK